MSRLLAIDGRPEAGGQILRSALSLSAVTGQGFEMKQIRSARARAGLRPDDLAAVRAVAMACGAKVGGAFDGSPDLRFEPGPVRPGEFRFEIAGPGAATLLLQTVLPVLASAGSPSRLEVTGGTHVPLSPSFHYLASHWAAAVAPLGLGADFELVQAGFLPGGGGEIRAGIRPWVRAGSLKLESRGALVSVSGVSGSARLKGDVAERQADAARARLWEAGGVEARLERVTVPSAGPGSFLLLEAVFERGRAALGFLGEPALKPDRLGDRAARRLLAFLEAEGAVDPPLADQLVVPLALAEGGTVTTSEVTRHMEAVAQVASLFGAPVKIFGRRGGPGGLEVGHC